MCIPTSVSDIYRTKEEEIKALDFETNILSLLQHSSLEAKHQRSTSVFTFIFYKKFLFLYFFKKMQLTFSPGNSTGDYIVYFLIF